MAGWVLAAGPVGFAGNELVAIYRIRVGRRIGSAALVADEVHARTDGFTSLAVGRRLMDGVDPELTERVEALIAEHSRAGGTARLRWSGHRLQVEITVPIPTDAHLVELASVTSNLEGGIRRALPHIGSVTIVPGFATDEAPRAG